MVAMAASGSFFLTEKRAGGLAEIYVGNKKAARFNLDQSVQKKTIATKIGNVELQFGDGAVQVTRSPCLQKICIQQGAIHHVDEHIVCLPAQLQVVITNGPNPSKSTDGLDAISY